MNKLLGSDVKDEGRNEQILRSDVKDEGHNEQIIRIKCQR